MPRPERIRQQLRQWADAGRRVDQQLRAAVFVQQLTAAAAGDEQFARPVDAGESGQAGVGPVVSGRWVNRVEIRAHSAQRERP